MTENREALSDRGGRGALQAAHESLADYPAIVAMHEEQTERAEAEVSRLRAENGRLRRAIELHRSVEYGEMPGDCDQAFLVALASIDATLYSALSSDENKDGGF